MTKEDDSYFINNRHKKRQFIQTVLIFLTVILIFFAGAVGGIGGVILLSSNNGSIAKRIGLPEFKDLTIPTTSTQKIVLEESNGVIDATSKVSSSVVSIVQKKTVQNIFGQNVQTEGAGTGFIITSDGLILTNKHVVSDQNAAYTIITLEGKSYDGTVKSVDPLNDIAVIKIDARNLPVVELGDSDQLKIGQWVVAVGNALGKFQNTVTVGVVSAKNRQIDASDSAGSSEETLSNLLQTDTAINPGNSGGPLVNLAGQVIGINTAIASNAQGIGFAIPINQAKSAIESIKKTGRIIRPYLGVRYYQIDGDFAKQNNISVDYGAYVHGNGLSLGVLPGSPADKAGIAEGDIILEVNGEKVTIDHSLLNLLQKFEVGQEVQLKVLSHGNEKTVNVKLEESK